MKEQLVMQNFTHKGFMKLQTYLDSHTAIQLSFLLQKTNEIKLHLLISPWETFWTLLIEGYFNEDNETQEKTLSSASIWFLLWMKQK